MHSMTHPQQHYVHECLNKVSINMCGNEESPFQKTIHDNTTDLVHQKLCVYVCMCVWWTFNERKKMPATMSTQTRCNQLLYALSTIPKCCMCRIFEKKLTHTSKKRAHLNFCLWYCECVCFFFKLHLQIFHHNIPLSGILGQSEIERENEKKPKLSPSFRIRLNKTNNAIALRCCFFRFACVTWIGLCKTFHSLIVSLFFGWFTAAFMCSTFFLANSILREGKTNKFQNCF